MEDRRIDGVTINNILLFHCKYKEIHVAVNLFCNKSQKTSKCAKKNSARLDCASCATLKFLPHFDVICDT